MDWIARTLPDPTVVGGVVLHPLTYGHWLLLARVVPWQDGPFPAEDVPMGMWITSRPWKEAWRKFRSRSALRWVRNLGKRARFEGLQPLVAGFEAYLAEALKVPPADPVEEFEESENGILRRKRKQKNTGAPIPVIVQLRLFALTQLHLKDDEVADMIVGDLIGLWLAHLSSTGKIRIGTGPANGALSAPAREAFHVWCNEQDRLMESEEEESHGV